MHPLNEYLRGRGEPPGRRDINRLIERHEWFTTARRARALVTGDPDPALILPAGFWATAAPLAAPDRTKASLTPQALSTSSTPDSAAAEADTDSDRIIDRFLSHGGHRIVPSEGEVGGAAASAGRDFDLDPDLVTEQLAEIYLKQGLHAEAKEIYRRLSLHNPEKSVYFAGVISRIDAEQAAVTRCEV
ncbi:MAG: hypothetical protein LBV18_00465 [Alistipes sp.]|jgi:hypothetical protein|nr:hypothetical protein [Alistipes sp.]